MNLFDMKTVVFSYTISNALCAVVITLLWIQNRRRFAGLGFWLADFVMQFAAIALIILRGVVPDFVSMVVSNVLVILGTILLYMGLERFTGRRGPQIHNYTLLAVFILVHTYFMVMQPSLAMRNINISLGLLVICFQCAWLMLYRADVEMRPITRGVGYVFVAFCVVSAARFVVDLAAPPENNFFHSNTFETLLILTYQMLFIALTFSLSLMVNRRLFVELARDMTERQWVEDALRQSEEKFSKAFHASPDAILISRLTDGRLIEVNEGFSRLSEYSPEEALSSSSIALSLWANPQDREKCISILRENHSVRNYEYDFRVKSGKLLNCLYSGEIITLGDETHILSVVHDITKRKQAEEALHRQNEYLTALQETTLDLVSQLDLNKLLENIVKRAAQLMGTTAGYLDLVEPETGRLKPRIGVGALAESLKFETEPGEGVAGIVWQTGQALVIDDYDAWTGRLNSFGRSLIRSIVGVPLLSGSQVVGVLGLAYDDDTDKTFTPEAVEVLSQFARLAAIAIENARLFAALQRELGERKRVEEILQLRLKLFEFAAVHSLEELMQKALDEIGVITNSPIGFYHFVEEDQKTLSLQAWSTRTEQEFCQAEGKGLHYNIDQAGVWVDCVYQRKPVIHNNYAALPHRKGLPPGHAAVARELVVPTMREGRVVSILGVGNKPSDYDEKDVEFVAYVADIIWTIVERKRAEAKLEEYRRWLEMQNLEMRKLSLAIKQSGSTIVITDTDGAIQYANPRFEQTSGYTVGEAIGHNPRFLKSGEQSADYYQYLWQTITGGQIWYGEFHNRRKDGTLYWEQATIAPVLNADGQITNYIAIKDDTTARKQAEEALRQRTLELQQRNEELQTALNTIKTLSGMVPICAWCGRKIQDDNGEWVKVETYIQSHSAAEFTHGICPDCKQKSMEQVAQLRHERG